MTLYFAPAFAVQALADAWRERAPLRLVSMAAVAIVTMGVLWHPWIF